MVMKRNMMARNLRRSIRNSMGRYIAIAMIIALGAGMFVGLRSTKMDMVATGREYMDAQRMFDLRLLSTYGWDRDQLEAISALDGLEETEGVFYSDLIVCKADGEDASVYRFYTIPQKLNRLVLLDGRMPERPDECLADGYKNKSAVIGSTVAIAEDNEDTALDQLTVKSFTVVGLVSTPLYMDMNRGNTSVGSGSIANYYFVPEEAFDVGYYTEIHASIPGKFTAYTDEYSNAASEAAERLKPLLEPFARERLTNARAEAEAAWRSGKKKYEDGVLEYQTEKADALARLGEAYQELLDGEQKLRDGEQELLDAQQAVEDGWKELEENRARLEEAEAALDGAAAGGQAMLNSASATLQAKQAELEAGAQQLEAGLAQINAALAEVKAGVSQIRSGLARINAGIQTLESLIVVNEISIATGEKALEELRQYGAPDSHLREAEWLVEQSKSKKEEYMAQAAELVAQRDALKAKLAEVTATQSELEAKKAELLAKRAEIREARAAITDGYQQIYDQRGSADAQIMGAQQQIANGKKEIRANEKKLRAAEKEIAEGRKALESSREELAKGWADYEAAKKEAEEKFAEAEADLAEAARKLEKAENAIEGITRTDVYVLDRGSNIGYSSLDSNSDIVAGVARVFPVFFLLVAALVCITTMTRMVDEERTQIGTLKALGYSNFAIISKYLWYAGSGAVLGCAIGIGLGSVGFPVVLWEAYKIILFVTPVITLRFDWQMAAEVTVMYTSAMLFVTWYCCHKALREVPAELIRPKAPSAGKALLIERLPLWRRVSFLNKVAIRNIFRYRQRLAMMLLGIGGCTALLMTGFGIRDSISKIVDVQFRDVTKYDLEVYFRSGRTEEEQQKFREDMGIYVDDVLFFYQVSGEIEAGGQTRDIYLIAAEPKISEFIDFHFGSEPVGMPGTNEVLLSTGMAEILNIGIGDAVVLRDPDMQTLQLTVSGIYENHVYNYAIIDPSTVVEQWGREAELQMAFASVRSGRNPNYAGACANGLEGVVNVSVSQQLADMVSKMMSAMDLVVIVVVFCAGVLAVVVLYNLTNININERIREIATIKVLGFNAMETAMYVFKENLVLSVFGTLFGIPLGRLLLEFVISQIKIDLIWIKPLLDLPSLLISVALTISMAVLVDSIFYFKLEKINMAEALKSVE